MGKTMRFKDKVAVVSGGARDIGRAISVRLAAEGARVVFNYYESEEQARDTMDAIHAAGGEAIAVGGDMTKQEDVDALIARAVDTYGGKIDVLVNVVGGLVARKTLQEVDVEFLEFVMKLNFTSCFMVTKAAEPYMGEGGAIVNFSSQAGRDGGGPGAWAYASSKGAISTLTRGLAKELGPKGIRVNALCPGMIATTFHDTFTKDQVRANVAAATPLKREGVAEEVADTVAYLASDESSFLTGVNLDINGGLFFS
jgi:3-oxoacyl-[acyl-carrier protein] reductase